MSLKRSSSLSKPRKSSTSSATSKADDKRDKMYESVYLQIFDTLDEEVSTSDELLLLLQYAGCNPSKKTVAKYWDDSTESYTFTQFCSICKQEEAASSEALMKAFKKIDRNNDGFITHNELSQLLTKGGERMTKAEVKAMFDDADFNGDGKLDYGEFCAMMDSTTKQCQEMYIAKGQKQTTANTAPVPFKDPLIATSLPPRKAPITTKLKTMHTDSNDVKPNMSEIVPTDEVTKAEPTDLSRWKFQTSKGCFYKEEDGSITSHRFQLKVTQPTSLWITVKHMIPKYGKYSDTILESDITIFLLESNSGRLISFSDVEVEDKRCLLTDVDIGVYQILFFTSGVKLGADTSESGRVLLCKGTGADGRLTRLCKNSLMEIFYRCDLDGNGFLNREEFNQFQKRSSGEECDDEAWDVVRGTVEMTPQTEITLKGFLDLNLMELQDPDGGQDELWITMESLGYSDKLLLSTACPFVVEVFTKKGQNELSLLTVDSGGNQLSNALIESIKASSSSKAIKNKRDLHLHVAELGNRTTIAVNNQSHSALKVKVDCSSSENLVSDQGKLDVVVELDSKTMAIVHHLLPMDKDKPTNLKYQETIVR